MATVSFLAKLLRKQSEKNHVPRHNNTKSIVSNDKNIKEGFFVSSKVVVCVRNHNHIDACLKITKC